MGSKSADGTKRVNFEPNVTMGLGSRFSFVTGCNFLKCHEGMGAPKSSFNLGLADRSLSVNFRCTF